MPVVIDAHCDYLFKQYHANEVDFFFPKQISYQAAPELLKSGGINAQVYALFITPQVEKLALEITLNMIAKAKQMVKDGITVLIKNIHDLDALKPTNLGMILSFEGAEVLERNLQLLPLFYELGVRNIGLAWSRKNLFCEGVMKGVDANGGEGLSIHGFELLKAVEDLGMVVDVSHLNRKGFSDVVKHYSRPFIASHSNAYALCPVSRNLTDEQLEQVAAAEGVVGMNFAPHFLTDKPEQASIDDVIRHIRYIVDKTNINTVGLGSDFDGIAMVPRGLENGSKFSALSPLLEENGFTKSDIAKIMGENFHRVFRAVWK